MYHYAHIGNLRSYIMEDVLEKFLRYSGYSVNHDIAAEVADVGEVIHRGAAGIHFHMAGGVGGEFSFLMGGGVVKIHNIHPFRVFV